MKTKIGLREFLLRRNYSNSILPFYITDACPVGCDHCGVDAPNLNLHLSQEEKKNFVSLIQEMNNINGYTIISITGGEPFFDRFRLQNSVSLFSEKKSVIVYTSGYWAKNAIPSWILNLLKKINTIIISVDKFHIKKLGKTTIIKAVETILASEVHLILQIIEGETDEKFLNILRELPGGNEIEINRTPLVYIGKMLNQEKETIQRDLYCNNRLPLITYEGKILPCCNEELLSMRNSEPSIIRNWNEGNIEKILNGFKKDKYLQKLKNSKEYIQLLKEISTEAYSLITKNKRICEICIKGYDLYYNLTSTI